MIDYSTVKVGDKLRIVGMGAPGFAKLGDVVTVTACTPDNHGRCDVVSNDGRTAYFVLTCGAQRLEHVEPSPCSYTAIDDDDDLDAERDDSPYCDCGIFPDEEEDATNRCKCCGKRIAP
jgi:hypothetical protein